MRRPASSWTARTTVISGRCDPPNAGWLVRITSPGSMARSAAMERTHAPSAPKCTGTLGAFAHSLPSAVRIPQEKSNRSLMLTLRALRERIAAIHEAIAVHRAATTSIGSTVMFATADVRTMFRTPDASIDACHPVSMTIVAPGSTMRAGPSTITPGSNRCSSVMPAPSSFRTVRTAASIMPVGGTTATTARTSSTSGSALPGSRPNMARKRSTNRARMSAAVNSPPSMGSSTSIVPA